MPKRLTLDLFLQRVSIIHGEKYDYSLCTDYKNYTTKMKIICPKHGIFEQRAQKHLNGQGCPKCYDRNKRASDRTKSEYDFINQANEIHNNKYDYSLVKYHNAHTKLKISCPEHGIFLKSPHKHLNSKQGCPKCKAKSSLLENKWLDDLGITERQYRFQFGLKHGAYMVDGFEPKTNTIYEFLGDFWHGNPKLYDATERNSKNGVLFGELYTKTFERFDLFRQNGYNIVYIWENDFNIGSPPLYLNAL